jgi:hypothetical protein
LARNDGDFDAETSVDILGINFGTQTWFKIPRIVECDISARHLLPEAVALRRASFVINLRANYSKSFPKF